MKNIELFAILKENKASYLERITHYDGDYGTWIAVDVNDNKIKIDIHSNDLLNRLEQSNQCELIDVNHPSWEKSLNDFEAKNNKSLNYGGGFEHNITFDQWAELHENPGDNKKLIIWKTESKKAEIKDKLAAIAYAKAS